MIVVDAISAASPDLPAGDADALRESIAKLGQLVPIVIWQGRVIDGRKRLAACEALGLEPVTVTIPEDATATEYASALNLLRTQYTTSQRAMYASQLATLTRSTARRAAWERGAPNKVEIELDRPLPGSLDHAAEVMGVGRGAVAAAKLVRRAGEPEVVAAVERGAISVNAARKIVTKIPRAEQATAVERVIALKKQGERKRGRARRRARARRATRQRRRLAATQHRSPRVGASSWDARE